MSTDNNVRIARLQEAILDRLGIDSKHAVFDFKDREGGVIKLNLITINPRHEQSFLFHSVKGLNKIEALEKMLEYVETHFGEENTYTIQWIKVGEDDLHTSYFRGRNVYDILDKFYFERDLTGYRIFSITLNPVA